MMTLSHRRVRGNKGDRGQRVEVPNSHNLFRVKEVELNRGEIPLWPAQVNHICDKNRPPSGLCRSSNLRKVGRVYGAEARHVFYEPRRSLSGPRFQFRLLNSDMTDDLWAGMGVPSLQIRDGAPTICQLRLLGDTAENETQVGCLANVSSNSSLCIHYKLA